MFLAVFSLVWIAFGTMLILYTDKVRSFWRKLVTKADIRKLAALPFSFGLVLLIGCAFHTELFWLLFILGFLAVSKGVYLYFGSLQQIRNLLEWWATGASEVTLRLWGIITLLLGITVFSYVL
jgi:hypothetical protein